MTLHEKLARQVMINVKKLAERRGLNSTQVAALAGISKAYQSQLESGNRSPSLETVCKYALALNVHVAQLIKE